MIGFINRDCIERRLLFLSAKGYCSCLQKATVLVCKRLLFLSAKSYCSCLQKCERWTDTYNIFIAFGGISSEERTDGHDACGWVQVKPFTDRLWLTVQLADTVFHLATNTLWEWKINE